MILFFKDGMTGAESAQIVIMTANMIPEDWSQVSFIKVPLALDS